MTIAVNDIPAVTPGGLTLTPAERLTLGQNGVLTVAQRDGSTLVIWLDGGCRLYEQYYPAAAAAALDRWRDEYPEAVSRFQAGDKPERDDGLMP